MKLEFCRLAFEKYTNVKFNEYPSIENRSVPCRRTDTEMDRHDGVNSSFFFPQFCEHAKKNGRLRTVEKYKTRQCDSYNCRKTFCLVYTNQLNSLQKVGNLNGMCPNIAQCVHRTRQESANVFCQQFCHSV